MPNLFQQIAASQTPNSLFSRLVGGFGTSPSQPRSDTFGGVLHPPAPDPGKTPPPSMQGVSNLLPGRRELIDDFAAATGGFVPTQGWVPSLTGGRLDVNEPVLRDAIGRPFGMGGEGFDPRPWMRAGALDLRRVPSELLNNLSDSDIERFIRNDVLGSFLLSRPASMARPTPRPSGQSRRSAFRSGVVNRVNRALDGRK